MTMEAFLCLFLLAVIISCAPPGIRNEDIQDKVDKALIVNRPDHLKAVALERDGQLNKDFRKELLVGNFETDTRKEKHDIKFDENESAGQIIEEMFKKADKDHDGYLTADELKHQIRENTKQHLQEGRKTSDQLFQQVDGNGDGLINWIEYKTYFLVKNDLVDKDHAAKHANEHSDNMDNDSRLKLTDEQGAFKRADADGNGLDEAEWLGFQHPENSKTMLNDMTNEILRSFDRDNDGQLTVEEFAYLPEGVVDNPEMDKEYVDARKHEFKTVIDLNNDGKASFDELRAYVDPLNEYHADEEVREIFEFADKNKDGKLTLKELLSRAEILVSSGFIHPRNRLHDDL